MGVGKGCLAGNANNLFLQNLQTMKLFKAIVLNWSLLIQEKHFIMNLKESIKSVKDMNKFMSLNNSAIIIQLRD